MKYFWGVHAIRFFFFLSPLHFYIDKYIHVQLNFNVFTIDISNIIDVLKWVKTTVQLYIY